MATMARTLRAAPSALRITIHFLSGASRRLSSGCSGQTATRASSRIRPPLTRSAVMSLNNMENEKGLKLGIAIILVLVISMIIPFFTGFEPALTALTFLLMMPLFGWAIYRFRLRIWLLALALAGHLAAAFYLEALGWWRYPAWA